MLDNRLLPLDHMLARVALFDRRRGGEWGQAVRLNRTRRWASVQLAGLSHTSPRNPRAMADR